MATRLGNVIYWALGALGGLLIALAAYSIVAGTGDRTFGIVLFLVAGTALWLIGRACRYILAGI